MILHLAQREVSGGWGREAMEQFAKGSNIPLEIFVVIFGVLLVFLAIRGTMLLIRRTRAKIRPLMLYHRVGRQLGLPAGDRWWLWRIARRAELASPITLLLSAATLDHHAAAAGGDADSPRARSNRIRSHRIGERLFGPSHELRTTPSADIPVSDSDGA